MLRRIAIVLSLVCILSVSSAQTKNSSGGGRTGHTLVINGVHNVTYSRLNISTSNGDCIQLINSTNVTIQASNIGPCGGRGVLINGGTGNKIYDNYIHVENLASGCCDTHDGVAVYNSANDTLRGNVIAYGETNVEGLGGATNLSVIGNALLNPRGPFPRGQNVQLAGASSSTISGNFAYSCTLDGSSGVQCVASYLYSENQEDSINLYYSSNDTVENNYVEGGHSPSGCGIIEDDSSSTETIANNIVYNTGQCGINVADGTDSEISGNKILNLNLVTGGGNTALMIWKEYTPPCGSVLVSGNTTSEVRSDGYDSGYWDGGGCDPITCDGTQTDVWSCNSFGSYNQLANDAAVKDPPPIPPMPERCVANSPFSTQTSVPGC